MKKIVFSLFFLLLFMGLGVYTVEAKDETYRSSPEGKAVLYYGDIPLHVVVTLEFDAENGILESVSIPVKNVEASFDKSTETFYVSVNRSHINEVLREAVGYENVNGNLSVNIDYHADSNKDYYHFRDYSADYSGSFACQKAYRDYEYRELGVINIKSGQISLLGANKDHTWADADFLVFEGNPDNYEEYYISNKLYSREEISNEGLLFEFDKRNLIVSIVEDERIDLGEVKEVLDVQKDSWSWSEEEGEPDFSNEDLGADSFYAEYNDKNRMEYSWAQYDGEGNPMEVTNNTKIEIDNSENEENIYNLFFEDDTTYLEDNTKILTFDHDGDLGGTAKISIYVGDKFEPGDILSVYYYNESEGTLDDTYFRSSSDTIDVTDGKPVGEGDYDELVGNHDLMVNEEGYIVFYIDHCSEYILVKNDVVVYDPNGVVPTDSLVNILDITWGLNFKTVMIVIDCILLLCILYLIIQRITRK